MRDIEGLIENSKKYGEGNMSQKLLNGAYPDDEKRGGLCELLLILMLFPGVVFIAPMVVIALHILNRRTS